MSYGDGGFFFLQPVGNGYSGVSLGSPSRVGSLDIAQQLRLKLQMLRLRLRRLQASPMTSSAATRTQVRHRISAVTRQLAAIHLADIRGGASVGPASSFTFRPAAPATAPEVVPEPLLWQEGPMVTTPGGMELPPMDELDMVVEEDVIEVPDSYLGRVMLYAQEKPLMALLGAAGLGYVGYKGYHYYRNRKG